MSSSALQDPRMIEVLGALMGVDMQASTREEGSTDLPEGATQQQARPATPPPAASSSSSSSSKAAPPPPPPAPAEDVEMLDDEEAQAKKEALAEKAAGAASYKAREFDDAIAHFQKAWDLWPKDATFLTNLSGTSVRPARPLGHSP